MNKRTLQRAFVATVTTSAATLFAGGCQTTEVITNPPMPTCAEEGNCVCPASPPAEGSDCPDVGMSCAFDIGGCPRDFTCEADGWEEHVTSCNPPPPDCPKDLPAAGSVCQAEWGYPIGCVYEVATPCGPEAVNASCTNGPYGLVWEHVYGGDPCQATDETCGGYDHPDVCGADAACQWLVPGCAEGTATVAVEGCYAASDCTQTGCGDWGTCETVVHDPCWNDLCNACGMDVDVCVPKDAE